MLGFTDDDSDLPGLERLPRPSTQPKACWHCAYWVEGSLVADGSNRCRNPLSKEHAKRPETGCRLRTPRTAGTVVIVVGHDRPDTELVPRALDLLHRERHVVLVAHAAISGTDKRAEDWASARGVACRAYPGDYRKGGRPTPDSMRERMWPEVQPDGLVAFAGGRHTSEQIKTAKRAGVPVWKPVPWIWRDPGR